LANPSGPKVIWLQGAGCTGCSVSLLNRISTAAGEVKDVGDLLINYINLIYHPNVMALAGQAAVDEAQKAYAAGGYVLAVEGAVPTGLGGNTCFAWTYNGVEVTFKDAVAGLAAKAAAVLCIGTCAAWGGLSAAPPNPLAVRGVKAATGKNTINIAGCPPHPDWIVWAVAQFLLGKAISLDTYGRPTALFNRTVHEQCPRRGREEAKQFGLDGYCLKELGCRGPETRCNCPVTRWNNKASWCVEVNAPCIGCTEPDFPGSNSFRHE
jgi:hydrogenase small subunit